MKKIVRLLQLPGRFLINDALGLSLCDFNSRKHNGLRVILGSVYEGISSNKETLGN